MKEYPLITSSLLTLLSMVHRMVIKEDGLSQLDTLLQKSLRYRHHKENYLLSVENGIIPSGLKINKKLFYQYRMTLQTNGITSCLMQKKS